MQYDFYEVVKAVVKKVSMVNPKPSNLCHDKVYSSTQEAGFEDIICGWVDVLELVKDMKNIKKQIIGYKAMGFDYWEIAAILSKSEGAIKQYAYRIKKYLEKSVTKSDPKRLYKDEGRNNV